MKTCNAGQSELHFLDFNRIVIHEHDVVELERNGHVYRIESVKERPHDPETSEANEWALVLAAAKYPVSSGASRGRLDAARSGSEVAKVREACGGNPR